MLNLRRAAPFVGALALAAAVLLGLGGAQARPGGVWLGWPSPAWAVAVLAAVLLGLAAWPGLRAWGHPALAACAGFALPLLLLAAGVPLAGVRAVSGPVLFVIALAGLTLVVARAGWRPGKLAFLPLVFLVQVVAAGRANVVVGPQGDEPHYLMVAESLWRDGDVSLERDYALGRYAVFHDAPLAPHFRVRGRQGEVYSLHAVGLSLLILPAWALAGYAGVTVFMALLAALLARELRQWVMDLCARSDLADGVAWLFALSPPLLHYAGLVFSEVPAALLVAYGLRRGRSSALGLGGALAVGLAAAALPWLNVRYLPLALVLLAHAAWRNARLRRIAALGAPFVLSAVGIGFYHHALYGFWDPRRVYGRRPELAISTLGEALPGLFLDQEFGLLVYAPVLVLAVPGLFWLLRRDRKLGLAALVAVLAVVLTAGSWHMWRGGFNPPGRFLVPIAPILALGVACVWERRGLTAGTLLLVGWGLWTGIGGACAPQLVHRDRDDTAPFFRAAASAREWTGLLPGFVLEEHDRRRLALLWAAALLLSIPWRARAVGARRLAAASLGLVAAAQLAAAASERPTGDRDAVRLVGRPGLAAPGWFVSSAVVGEWKPADLGWGPLYEPHRHPAGAALGRRLRLSPGRYELELSIEDLAPGAAPPSLELVPDRPGAPARVVPLRAAPAALRGRFEIAAGDPGLDLRLRDGGPMLLLRIRLRRAQGATQPSGRPLV